MLIEVLPLLKDDLLRNFSLREFAEMRLVCRAFANILAPGAPIRLETPHELSIFVNKWVVFHRDDFDPEFYVEHIGQCDSWKCVCTKQPSEDGTDEGLSPDDDFKKPAKPFPHVRMRLLDYNPKITLFSVSSWVRCGFSIISKKPFSPRNEAFMNQPGS